MTSFKKKKVFRCASPFCAHAWTLSHEASQGQQTPGWFSTATCGACCSYSVYRYTVNSNTLLTAYNFCCFFLKHAALFCVLLHSRGCSILFRIWFVSPYTLFSLDLLRIRLPHNALRGLWRNGRWDGVTNSFRLSCGFITTPAPHRLRSSIKHSPVGVPPHLPPQTAWWRANVYFLLIIRH